MLQQYIANALLNNKTVFSGLLSGLSEQEYLWKPAPEKWCLLEIVCHLYDEEREDFRARVKHVLEQPHLPMMPIDPQGWVADRKYMEEDYDGKLAALLVGREQSVKWLLNLNDPQWDNFIDHSILGKLSAKLFLSNWLAHDYLHIRQIMNLKFNYLQHTSGESLTYAGNW